MSINCNKIPYIDAYTQPIRYASHPGLTVQEARLLDVCTSAEIAGAHHKIQEAARSLGNAQIQKLAGVVLPLERARREKGCEYPSLLGKPYEDAVRQLIEGYNASQRAHPSLPKVDLRAARAALALRAEARRVATAPLGDPQDCNGIVQAAIVFREALFRGPLAALRHTLNHKPGGLHPDAVAEGLHVIAENARHETILAQKIQALRNQDLGSPAYCDQALKTMKRFYQQHKNSGGAELFSVKLIVLALRAQDDEYFAATAQGRPCGAEASEDALQSARAFAKASNAWNERAKSSTDQAARMAAAARASDATVEPGLSALFRAAVEGVWSRTKRVLARGLRACIADSWFSSDKDLAPATA